MRLFLLPKLINRLFLINRFSPINGIFYMVKISLLVTPVYFFRNMFAHFYDINLSSSCNLCCWFQPFRGTSNANRQTKAQMSQMEELQAVSTRGLSH